MHSLTGRFVAAALLVLGSVFVAPFARAEKADSPRIGVVLMHGKGGSPSRHVAELARQLESQGMQVANLEMPWSGRRHYEVDVTVALAEVDAALTTLRGQGAQKLFIAGHSQGGVFALYVGTRSAVDGVVAIAPGGNVANPVYRDKLGTQVALARQRVAEGRGAEKITLADYEGSKGTFAVECTSAAYLSWFDPDGAMNQLKSSQVIKPAIPVLFIAPRDDYPGLQRVKQQMFAALPHNAHTRLYEPEASHLGAPAASAQEIVRWTRAVATAGTP